MTHAAAPATALQGAHPEQLKRAFELIQRECQVDLRGYRETTFERQLLRRMAELGETQVASYLARLSHDAEELQNLRRSVLISVTRFFRDAHVFAGLAEQLRQLVGHSSPGESLRIWVPGCATGEEAYTVAILLTEALEQAHRPVQARIFATDVDGAAIASARAGQFGLSALEELDAARLERHFTRHGEHFQVSKAVRDLCVFAEHDLLSHTAFVNLDLVVCRNVLIYFQSAARQAVIQRFAHALRPGGLLLLGQSEGLAADDPQFTPLARDLRLYRRNAPAGQIVPRARPVAPEWTQPDAVTATLEARRSVGVAHRLQQLLVQRDARPTVVIDGRGHVQQLSGNLEPYLRLGGGQDLSLFNVLRDELRMEARALLRLAQNQPDQEARSPWMSLSSAHGPRPIRLLAQTLPGGDGPDGLVALSFDAPAAGAGLPHGAEAPAPHAVPSDATALSAELQLSREQLHAMAHNFEQSEQARRAVIEDLQVSSEELQAANEELQASNEELYSLNELLTEKSAELGELNDTLLSVERSVGLSMVVLDSRLCVKRFNPSAVRIFGLLPSDIGRPLAALPASLDLPSLNHQLNRVLQTGEGVIDRIDQGTRHYVMQLSALRDHHEAVRGVVACFADVADMRQAELERARLAAIVDSSTDAIVGKGLDGLISSWNPGAQRLFGYTAEDAIGQPMLMVFPPELQAQERELLNRISQGESIEPFDTVRMHRNGTRVHVSVSLSPIRDATGQIVGVSTIARDVSERVIDEAVRKANLAQLETLVGERTQQLSDNQQFIESILQCMPGFVSYWDLRLNLKLANDAYLALMQDRGATADAGLHALGHWLDPRVCEHTRAQVQAALGGDTVSFELGPLDLAEGRGRHLSVTFRPHVRRGKLAGFIALAFDISPIRQAQEAAHAASRAKSDFLASVSHEIRTPLNAVLGLAQVGERRPSDASTREVFSRINQAGQHLLELINDVLDFSRIEAGKMSMHPAAVNMDNLIKRVTDIVAAPAQVKGLSLHIERAPELLPTYVGDAMRITQLLINLLGNAVKFTEQGEVTLVLGPEAGGVALEVRDTGPGMDEDLLARLFRPFERGDTSRTRRSGGSGLGLAICHRLVELMGGRIEVHSVLGSGSRFRVWLPLLPATAENLSAGEATLTGLDPKGGTARLAGLHILLVEDNPVNVLVCQELLRMEGAHCDVAEHGGKALERIGDVLESGALRYDLVLCDIEMPVMDGYETTRQLQALCPELPVIGLTAHAFDDARQLGRAAGMSSYVTKPIALDLLVTEILLVLGGQLALPRDPASPD